MELVEWFLKITVSMKVASRTDSLMDLVAPSSHLETFGKVITLKMKDMDMAL